MNCRRSLPLAALLALALCATGCKHGTAGGDDDAAPAAPVVASVQAQQPQVASIADSVRADAVLSPVAQAALVPKVSAPVRRFYVQRGDRVRKGQLLATLESADLAGAALDSRGALTTAQATYNITSGATVPEDVQKAQLDVAQAKANLDLANRTATERKRLLSEGAISGREADTASAAAVQAQAAYDIAVKHLQGVQQISQTATLKSAQGQLQSAQGRFQSAEAQVSYANLRSPISGVVTDRSLFAGETPAAGAPVLTVMDTSSLLAKIHIAQPLAQSLQLGDEAEVEIPGLDQPVTGKVSLISPALDPGSTTVEVWVKLLNPRGTLRAGTPVRVVVHGRAVKDALTLPAAAVVPGAEGTGTSVMVIAADNTAHKRPVQLGIRTADTVQILSGVTAADRVIVHGGYGLDDGSKVKVEAAQPAAAAGGDDK